MDLINPEMMGLGMVMDNDEIKEEKLVRDCVALGLDITEENVRNILLSYL